MTYFNRHPGLEQHGEVSNLVGELVAEYRYTGRDTLTGERSLSDFMI